MDLRNAKSHADHRVVQKLIFARWKEVDGDIIQETVDGQDQQREIMDEETTATGSNPTVMKDQNVSLDRCPSKENRLRVVQTPIDE